LSNFDIFILPASLRKSLDHRGWVCVQLFTRASCECFGQSNWGHCSLCVCQVVWVS